MEIEKYVDLTVDYSRYLAEFRINPSRERRSVMYRNAYATVLADYFGPSDIARITSRHHATIIYCRKTHESNLRFDANYIVAYAHCSKRIADIIGERPLDTNPYGHYSRTELMEAIETRDREILELKYQLKIAQERCKPEETVQGIW
jgi:hypothetical protein